MNTLTHSLSRRIAQLYIHADSIEDHVVAIIVPDPLRFARKLPIHQSWPIQ